MLPFSTRTLPLELGVAPSAAPPPACGGTRLSFQLVCPTFPAGISSALSWRLRVLRILEAVICQMVPTSLHSLLLGKQLCQTIPVALFPLQAGNPNALNQGEIKAPVFSDIYFILQLSSVGHELCTRDLREKPWVILKQGKQRLQSQVTSCLKVSGAGLVKLGLC